MIHCFGLYFVYKKIISIRFVSVDYESVIMVCVSVFQKSNDVGHPLLFLVLKSMKVLNNESLRHGFVHDVYQVRKKKHADTPWDLFV